MEGTWLLLSVTVCLLVISLFILFTKRSKTAAMINMLPGPPTIPILGNMLLVMVPLDELAPRICEVVKDFFEVGVFRGWLGPKPFVIIVRGEQAQVVLSNPHFTDKSDLYQLLVPTLGWGLVTKSGKKWHDRRRLLTPAFHFRILEDFVPIFNKQSEIFVKILDTYVGKPPFEMFPLISYFSLDTICETAMGISMNVQSKTESSTYAKALYTASNLEFKRILNPFFYYDWIYNLTPSGRTSRRCHKYIHDFSMEVILKRKEEYVKDGKPVIVGNESADEGSFYGENKKKLAFLDILLEYSDEGKVLSVEDIHGEVISFMNGGHDTSSGGIFWTLYFLGKNPEAQEKAYQENYSIFGDSQRPVTSEDIRNMRYLDSCFKEALRLCPSAPIIARKITKQIKIGDYVVPEGVDCVIIPYAIHRNPVHFKDPLRYDPDRFLPENIQGRHGYSFIPFSAGPRNCIELLTTSLNLIKDFTKLGITKVWLGYKPYVLLTKAETVQPLLSSRKEINRSHIYSLLSPSRNNIQTGTLTSQGENWHKRRKLLNPAFNFRVLGEFLHIFNEKGQRFIQRIEKESGKCVDFYYLTTVLALDIICATAMGYDINAKEDEQSTYVTASLQSTQAIFTRVISPWYHSNFIWKISPLGREYSKNVQYKDNLARKIISKKKQELHQRKLQQENIEIEQLVADDYNENTKQPTFIDLLVECSNNGKTLSDDDILEEVGTFIYAGHDSTAISLFWTLFYVGRNPHVQEKIQREVDMIFGDSDRSVDKDDLPELKYMECVYKEVLRLCPAFPVFGRKLQDDIQIGEYTIPSGTDVIIPIYVIHRDPDHFPDPEKFDPDRFLPDNCNGRNPYAYIPFSAGPRNCIGQKYAAMELKVILAYIFRNFKITTLYDGEVKMTVEMVLRPVPEETVVLLEKRTTRYFEA